MVFNCPNCFGGELAYRDANQSKCDSCGHTVPNAHLYKYKE